ncbi:hexokinase-2-like [Macrobrachium rosenbergii]|uniref:hexokinase-2-like n=1 Tax=Macrobrachium rosenbergii TaxID=79674 RepID=UPI0034D755D7
MPSPTELPSLHLSDSEKQAKILERVRPLILTNEQCQKIGEVFLDEMRLGLALNPEREPSLLMENTFIPELPDGTENGEFLALDLGGTNFRVIYVKMAGGQFTEEVVDLFQIPEAIRFGPGEKLFDFLANCLSEFIAKRKFTGRKFQLGFAFSFPMTLKSLDAGILASWTKSFKCSGTVGKDVVRMLNEAIERRGDLDVAVTAILSDATGTLVQGAYLDKRCAMGMILGTGCNGCYIEKVKNIEKWRGKHPEDEVIVDIEWGSFGDNGVLDFIRTEWDRAVDAQSLLAHSYTFEKYIAGKYLGDLFRVVLLTLGKEGLFSRGSLGKLETQGSITTKNISDIEGDALKGSASKTREMLETIGLEFDQDDILVTQYIAGVLSHRGCVLVSILAGLLLKRMERPHCTVAVDGSLFRCHPRFKPLLEKLISEAAPGRSFDLRLAHDGSGKGAALIAAIAERLRKRTS